VTEMRGDHDTAIPSPLSPVERRQRNRQEMLDAILLHARQIMREEGVAALNLRELARRLRFTVQALYKYYPSKAALYDALFREGIRIASAQWSDAMGGGASFWEKLENGLMAIMRFAHEYPELNEITFSRPVPGFVPSEESLRQSVAMLQGLDRLIEDAQERGELRPDVAPTEVRDLYLAMLDGLTRQHAANEPETPIGSGRYGSLIPAAMVLFRRAWEPRPTSSKGYDDADARP
jgi:AcrR family transcriptional regulator